MTAEETCSVQDCGQPSIVLLETRPLCVTHFISTSYERIDEYSRAVTEHRLYETYAEQMWHFVVDCIARSADLTQCAEEIDNLSRARLLDILLRAADLTRFLRRSTRRAAEIPVRLRCEKLGRGWEEQTRTMVLSRFGAMLECRHPIEAGDKLLIVRLDNGEQARARVTWKKDGAAGHAEIGIELLNCDNFWGIEWGGAEGYRP